MANSVAVFVFAGFLESGKTTALQGMLLSKREILDGKSVIISTEDGEEQYKKDILKELDIDVIEADDEEFLPLSILRK